jgi:hypothetical protein
LTPNLESHKSVYREIKLKGRPLTSSQKKVERKQNLKDLLENEIRKDLPKIRKKCENENHQNPDTSNAIVLAEVMIPITCGVTIGVFLFTRRTK